MKSVIISLLFIFSIGISVSYAQTDNKSIERDVKMSGTFYFGEGIDSNVDSARTIALKDLQVMVMEELMSDNPELTTVDFGAIDDDFNTTEIDLEGQTKVLMYVLKSELEFTPKGKKRVVASFKDDKKVTQAMPAPNMEITIEEPSAAAPSVATTTPKAATAAPAAAPKNEPSDNGIESMVMAMAMTKAGPKAGSNAGASAGAKSGSNSGANAEPNAGTKTPTSPKTVSKGNDPIIRELIEIGNYNVARHTLNRYKYKKKLMHGPLSTISTPQDCLFLVIDDGQIVDVLDTGLTAYRKGLISGKNINYNDVKETIVWITIL